MKIAYRIESKEELEEIYMHVIIEIAQWRVVTTREALHHEATGREGIFSDVRHKFEVLLCRGRRREWR